MVGIIIASTTRILLGDSLFHRFPSLHNRYWLSGPHLSHRSKQRGLPAPRCRSFQKPHLASLFPVFYGPFFREFSRSSPSILCPHGLQGQAGMRDFGGRSWRLSSQENFFARAGDTPVFGCLCSCHGFFLLHILLPFPIRVTRMNATTFFSNFLYDSLFHQRQNGFVNQLVLHENLRYCTERNIYIE